MAFKQNKVISSPHAPELYVGKAEGPNVTTFPVIAGVIIHRYQGSRGDHKSHFPGPLLRNSVK